MPAREQLMELLHRHQPTDPYEESMRQRMIEFVSRNAECLSQSLREGHITASAWVVDAAKTRVLLTWHKKLNRWLQLGGHVNTGETVLKAARREACEESGLRSVLPLSAEIFDIDIHSIPARGDEPAHLHYDVRFLFVADAAEPLVASEESNRVAWIQLAELESASAEPSLLRMRAKTARLAAIPPFTPAIPAA
jgi:ADP-ribose pyrophosphatase YjhB (NUDIX family)